MRTAVRDALIFAWFSATSFYHGYALLLAAYLLLPSCLFAGLLVVYLFLMFGTNPEHSGNWTLKWFRDGAVTKAPLAYFSAEIVGAAELKSVADERCLFGFHPHGIYPMAGVLACVLNKQ